MKWLILFIIADLVLWPLALIWVLTSPGDTVNDQS